MHSFLNVCLCYCIYVNELIDFFFLFSNNPTNTPIFCQAPSTLSANTVNNNCDMAPDEV